jgi:hypothetical protein
MQATSPYLNKPLRTIEEAMRASAEHNYLVRVGGLPEGEQCEPFELSQEFRDYRLAFRDTVNG